jgi:hypothetical protein
MSTIAPWIRKGNLGELKPELAGPDFFVPGMALQANGGLAQLTRELRDSYNRNGKLEMALRLSQGAPEN